MKTGTLAASLAALLGRCLSGRARSAAGLTAGWRAAPARVFRDSMAATIPRSAAGSSTAIPPATFTNTSSAISSVR